MKLPINTKAGYRFGARPYPLRVKNPDGSIFGFAHHGQDFPAKVGTPVVAPHAGTVTLAGANGSAGNEVRILSGKTQSRLLHLSQVKVKTGQRVTEGQLVGLSGNTGFTTGPHLHWSLSVNGRYVNPLAHLTPAKSPKPAPKPKPQPVYHRVVWGNTVSRICQKYGISLTTFKRLNPQVKNLNLIFPGQRVRVK